MLTWLKSRAEDRRTAIDLYGAIVAQARASELFARLGVEDTPEGRTAVIIAVMSPVLERLAADGAGAGRLARYVTETFVTDVDDSLREMGVGDMGVPRKVKRAAQALGERALAYRAAMRSAEPQAALARELAASVPGLDSGSEGASALAQRMLSFKAALATVPRSGLVAAIASFSAAPDGPAKPSGSAS